MKELTELHQREHGVQWGVIHSGGFCSAVFHSTGCGKLLCLLLLLLLTHSTGISEAGPFEAVNHDCVISTNGSSMLDMMMTQNRKQHIMFGSVSDALHYPASVVMLKLLHAGCSFSQKLPSSPFDIRQKWIFVAREKQKREERWWPQCFPLLLPQEWKGIIELASLVKNRLNTAWREGKIW